MGALVEVGWVAFDERGNFIEGLVGQLTSSEGASIADADHHVYVLERAGVHHFELELAGSYDSVSARLRVVVAEGSGVNGGAEPGQAASRSVPKASWPASERARRVARNGQSRAVSAQREDSQLGESEEAAEPSRSEVHVAASRMLECVDGPWTSVNRMVRVIDHARAERGDRTNGGLR